MRSQVAIEGRFRLLKIARDEEGLGTQKVSRKFSRSERIDLIQMFERQLEIAMLSYKFASSRSNPGSVGFFSTALVCASISS